MALVRPRLNDYFDIEITQATSDFAIPFLDDDLPLYVDPFLLWKSPSQAENGLHLSLINSFNYLGYLAAHEKTEEAKNTLIRFSECNEVGLGHSGNRKGHLIGDKLAEKILTTFLEIPQITKQGFKHFEELQLFIDNFSIDRISDISCNLIKSHLIDYTIDQCEKNNIPTHDFIIEIYNSKNNKFLNERAKLPFNPENDSPILLVPKRWLRKITWINQEDYIENFLSEDLQVDKKDRVAILNFNRDNYDYVSGYIEVKERNQDDCKNDLLFKSIPILSAKRKLNNHRL